MWEEVKVGLCYFPVGAEPSPWGRETVGPESQILTYESLPLPSTNRAIGGRRESFKASLFYFFTLLKFCLCVHLCQPIFPETYNQWFNSEPSDLFPGATGIMGFVLFLKVKEVIDGFSVPFVRTCSLDEPDQKLRLISSHQEKLGINLGGCLSPRQS